MNHNNLCARCRESVPFHPAARVPMEHKPGVSPDDIRLATLAAVKKGAKSDAEAVRNYREAERVIRAALSHLTLVAEEPEWEYGVALFGEMDDIQPWATEAKARAARQDAEDLLIRRRKAGPWVPVE